LGTALGTLPAFGEPWKIDSTKMFKCMEIPLGIVVFLLEQNPAHLQKE